ncbi:MAG TPA: TonB-dependent receptor [Chitinophagaceae bacterium]|nr:TonB-dependent receptor [Chitinophagaceae bacterium]
MKQFLLSAALGFLTVVTSFAQFPGGGQGRPGGANRQNMNIGHFYGRVIDSKTNKGIDGATVQLIGNRFDTATKKMSQAVIATVLSSPHGDFSLENLSLFGNYKLHISVVGYADYSQNITFGIKFGGGQGGNNSGQNQQDRMQQVMSMADKDLGNIKIVATDATLAAVTVTATKPFFEMGVDRKIFNVDKNIVSTGQTATEVMKQIPSLNVDIDGNVTMRNATPQLFIDGRPTTLTLDQIPADLIDRVELITNPSAKYDASGGGAGILNLVLKKNIKKGYNGGIRAGIDSRGKFNGGLDLNYRHGKINFFINGMLRQRLTKYTNTTVKNDYFNNSHSDSVYTQDNGQNTGGFGFLRGGFDYFMDNRNTLSFTVNYNKGQFTTADTQSPIDSIKYAAGSSSYSSRVNASDAHFENFGSQLSFKHNFTKNGHDITADINYNSSDNKNTGNNITNTYLINMYQPEYSFFQNTIGSGTNRFLTIQSDYENPITENAKLETGVRAAIRNFTNVSDISTSYAAGAPLTKQPLLSSDYKFTDQVYAAYVNYSFKGKKWNYQAGLRAESSNYKGTNNLGNDTTFKVEYPVSLFPSAFITYKMTDRSDLQVNYSRRINRPNFFQLLPSRDLTDIQNPRKGNPDLKPEFTNSFEVSYDKSYAHSSNFLATAYMRYTTGLITSYYYRDISPTNPSDSVLYTTYINANSSMSYGLELTDRTTILKIWDMSLNVNLYDSKITVKASDKTNTGDINNERVSWFAKLNNNFKLPKKISIQFSGNYQAKTVLPQGGGQGRGGGFFGGPTGSAQGYSYPFYSFDMAVKKDWQWKGGNSASVTISMNDIFRTALYKTYSAASGDVAFDQITERRRDPQILRINLSYRFGKVDADLFKRRNNTQQQDNSGGDMMGGGIQ